MVATGAVGMWDSKFPNLCFIMESFQEKHRKNKSTIPCHSKGLKKKKLEKKWVTVSRYAEVSEGNTSIIKTKNSFMEKKFIPFWKQMLFSYFC